MFGIPVDVAIKTLRMTETQNLRNTDDITLNLRQPQDDAVLRYGRMNWHLYPDTGFASGTRGKSSTKGRRRGTSTRDNTCFQVSATEFGWVSFVPMATKSNVSQALKKVFKKYGVPDVLHVDPAREQISGETRKMCNRLNCTIAGTEKGIPCKRAEAAVRLFKHRTCRRMYESGSPAVFWDYCGEREAMVMNSTAKVSPVFQFK